MDDHGIGMLYTYINVDLAQYEKGRVEVGKGGIVPVIAYSFMMVFIRCDSFWFIETNLINGSF